MNFTFPISPGAIEYKFFKNEVTQNLNTESTLNTNVEFIVNVTVSSVRHCKFEFHMLLQVSVSEDLQKSRERLHVFKHM